MSTTESEYIAMSEIVKEEQCVRQLQKFIRPGIKAYYVNIMKDNEEVIKFDNHPIRSNGTRPIDVKQYFLR